MAEFTQFDAKPEVDPDFKPAPGFKFAVLSSNGTPYIDWKNSENLRRFLTPNGKVQGRKKTGLSAREQRMVAQAIKRSRYMGLLPYTSATL